MHNLVDENEFTCSSSFKSDSFSLSDVDSFNLENELDQELFSLQQLNESQTTHTKVHNVDSLELHVGKSFQEEEIGFSNSSHPNVSNLNNLSGFQYFQQSHHGIEKSLRSKQNFIFETNHNYKEKETNQDVDTYIPHLVEQIHDGRCYQSKKNPRTPDLLPSQSSIRQIPKIHQQEESISASIINDFQLDHLIIQTKKEAQTERLEQIKKGKKMKLDRDNFIMNRKKNLEKRKEIATRLQALIRGGCIRKKIQTLSCFCNIILKLMLQSIWNRFKFMHQTYRFHQHQCRRFFCVIILSHCLFQRKARLRLKEILMHQRITLSKIVSLLLRIIKRNTLLVWNDTVFKIKRIGKLTYYATLLQSKIRSQLCRLYVKELRYYSLKRKRVLLMVINREYLRALKQYTLDWKNVALNKVTKVLKNFYDACVRQEKKSEKAVRTQEKVTKQLTNSFYGKKSSLKGSKWSIIEEEQEHRIQANLWQTKLEIKPIEILQCHCKSYSKKPNNQKAESTCHNLKGITDQMLLGLRPLAGLKELDLNVEDIEDVSLLASKIGGGSSLISLSLNVNKISSSLSCFDSFLNLKILSLNDNCIFSLEGIQYLANLVELFVESNFLECLCPLGKDFRNTRLSLKTIKLGTNRVKKLPSSLGFSTPFIENICLYHNKIVSIPLSFLNNLNFVTCIDLGSNRLHNSEIIGEALSMAPSLQKVILSQNRLKSLPVPLILPMLNELWLSGNSIMNGSQWVCHKNVWLPCLKKLYLEDNCIANIDNLLFTIICPHLEELDLSFNELNRFEDILKSIIGLSFLFRINILDNNFETNECVENDYKQIIRAVPSLNHINGKEVLPSNLWAIFATCQTKESLYSLPMLQLLCKENEHLPILTHGHDHLSEWNEQVGVMRCENCNRNLNSKELEEIKHTRCPMCSYPIIPSAALPLLLNFKILRRHNKLGQLLLNIPKRKIQRHLSRLQSQSKSEALIVRKKSPSLKKGANVGLKNMPIDGYGKDSLQLYDEGVHRRNNKHILNYDTKISTWKNFLSHKIDKRIQIIAATKIRDFIKQVQYERMHVKRREAAILLQKQVRGVFLRKRLEILKQGNFVYVDDELDNLMRDDPKEILKSVIEIDDSIRFKSEFQPRICPIQCLSIPLDDIWITSDVKGVITRTSKKEKKLDDRVVQRIKGTKQQQQIMEEWGFKNRAVARTMLYRRQRMFKSSKQNSKSNYKKRS